MCAIILKAFSNMALPIVYEVLCLRAMTTKKGTTEIVMPLWRWWWQGHWQWQGSGVVAAMMAAVAMAAVAAALVVSGDSGDCGFGDTGGSGKGQW